ncbi:MAG: GPO family capsid scaffolding protein [Janthinobacterium lividum]
MANKTKFFRVATEGATTDGRTIERVQIEQMAAQYDPAIYGARVNLEHFRGIMPDGPFRAYGDVLALEARDVENGKRALFAQIEPTKDLVAMTTAKQKIYTSIEIDPSFADTKQAYLVGLAVTDSPASLGTEVLTFAARNPAASPFAARKQSARNLFSETVEATIELDTPSTPNKDGVSLLARVADVLGLVKKKTADDDTRFADMTLAVEALATHGAKQVAALEAVTEESARQAEVLAKLTSQLDASDAAFKELHQQLSATGNGYPSRPLATGGNGGLATDC